LRWSVADTTYRRRYAERAKEHLVASARAAFILGRTHDRAGVYAMLAGGGIEPAGSRQLLF
jgi:arylsulfatase A-like enzyme